MYILITVAAIIPAMLLAMTGIEDPKTGQIVGQEILNVWQVISTSGSIQQVDGMLGFATTDMVFIFADLLMAIFILHDYSLGFIKNIFHLTVHSKKQD